LYITILSHQRNRAHQAHLIHQQSLLLNSIIDPSIVPVEDAPRFVVKRTDWIETWKDRWNAEVEGAVKWVHGIQLGRVREGLERRAEEWREGERRV
jgi:altered-inheritance-of-mitochondria protein 5